MKKDISKTKMPFFCISKGLWNKQKKIFMSYTPTFYWKGKWLDLLISTPSSTMANRSNRLFYTTNATKCGQFFFCWKTFIGKSVIPTWSRINSYEFMIDHCSYTHNLRRPEQDLNPWPLQYQCSALPTILPKGMKFVGEKNGALLFFVLMGLIMQEGLQY